MIDAYKEFGESMDIDLVAHLHRISVQQIQADLYGDPTDIKRRFGTKSSIKLQHALEKCLEEIKEGVDPALTAVAHHIPYKLIRIHQENPNAKQVAADFFRNIHKSNEAEQEKNCEDFESSTNSIDVR